VTLLAGPLLLALIAAAPQGSLQDARVRIAIVGDTAHVDARYRITDPGDSIRLHAPRVAGQHTAFDRRFDDPRLRLDTLPGLFRLTALGEGRGITLNLRYSVRGDLSRIPLFVPEAPSTPGQSRVTILVDGLAPDRAARFVVPRFTRESRGPWRATPDHLPSVVALVKPARGLPVPALAQWSVLLIAFAGTLAWLLTHLAARRRT
jgi:hypothetical protein